MEGLDVAEARGRIEEQKGGPSRAAGGDGWEGIQAGSGGRQGPDVTESPASSEAFILRMVESHVRVFKRGAAQSDSYFWEDHLAPVWGIGVCGAGRARVKTGTLTRRLQ